MWRAAYREHVEACRAALDWLVAQDEPSGTDDEPVRRYAESWYRLAPLLRAHRGPRVVAEAFDSTLTDVLREVRRTGTVVPITVYRGDLASYLVTMRAYALFRPVTMLPVILTPLVLPVLALVTFSASSRSALDGLPDWLYLALTVTLITVNAGIVYAIVQRLSNRPHLYGPYAFWFVPPSLASFVVLFSMTYWVPSGAAGSCMNEPLSRVDAVYFSLTTFTTTGYGDLHAVTPLCRGLASFQMATTFVLVILGLALFVSRVSSARPMV